MNRKTTTGRASLKLAVLALAIWSMSLAAHALSRAATQQQDPQRSSIGRTYKDSKPSWELSPQAPKGAPNVIYLLDSDRVMRSDDGGGTWQQDVKLEQQFNLAGAGQHDVLRAWQFVLHHLHGGGVVAVAGGSSAVVEAD